MPTERQLNLRCSFCGKIGWEAWPMAEGPNDVAICRDCVIKADLTVRDEQAKAADARCAWCNRTRAQVSGISELTDDTYLCLDCEAQLVNMIRGGWKP